MNKTVNKPVQIGEKRARFSFKIYDDPTTDSRTRQLAFLQEFIDCPSLLQCGPGLAQKMALWHDGNSWIMTGEAEGDVV